MNRLLQIIRDRQMRKEQEQQLPIWIIEPTIKANGTYPDRSFSKIEVHGLEKAYRCAERLMQKMKWWKGAQGGYYVLIYVYEKTDPDNYFEVKWNG